MLCINLYISYNHECHCMHNCHLYAYADLQVTSLPSVLFESNGGVHNVVEGSVIQLYCSVVFSTATFTWTIDGSPAVFNVPHLRERTVSNDTANITTSTLTVDNFQSSDSGTYQCLVENSGRTYNGSATTLIGKYYHASDTRP